MAGWHHWLDGCESEWTSGVGDGQEGLACCNSWSCKVLETTEQLNWTELNWDSILKSRDITLPTKIRLVKAVTIPVVVYGCDSWTIKKAEYQRIDAFELWCCKEIQPVHSKGDQSWVLFGKNDAKAETPILWPPHAKSWLIGTDSDAGRD